jgi:hypothetical protein
MYVLTLAVLCLLSGEGGGGPGGESQFRRSGPSHPRPPLVGEFFQGWIDWRGSGFRVGSIGGGTVSGQVLLAGELFQGRGVVLGQVLLAGDLFQGRVEWMTGCFQVPERRPYTLEHAHTTPCAYLFDAPPAWLCCRSRGVRYHFRPTFHRRRTLVLIAALLLKSGIESNPGPVSHRNLQLNLGLTNAQSIVNKAALVHDVITENQLDLLAVTETWVYEDSPDVHKREAAPNGYSVVHVHRKLVGAGGVKKCGGGVALIHRSDIRVTLVPTRPVAKSFELLLAKVANCTLGLTIAIVYRAPGTSVGEFVTELSDLVDSGRLGLRYVICGDLNCPGPAGTKGLIAEELAEFIDGHSLRQHVIKPTHRAGNILDHILTPDDRVTITDTVVQDVGLSDHYLVKCQVAASIDRPPIVQASFRNWKRLDLDKFKARLRYSTVCTQPATTASAFASQLQDCVTTILDELAPMCTSTKRRQKPDSRWLSEEAIEAKRARRRLERKWVKTGRTVESIRKEYRAACRAANELITESRRKFYAERVTQSSHDPRALWRCVKGLLHTNHSAENNECGMSQRSADFFKSKVAKVKSAVSTLKAQLTAGQQHQQQVAVTQLDTLGPTTIEEVSRLISRLPNKTSPLDYIHTSVVKACSEVFAPLITNLANLSFAEGWFPGQFKLAQVTPLLKKAGLDTSDPANYRPISNLNTISKIIERLCLARLVPHIASTGNFNPLQSAYRKQHSTETALLKILDDLNKVVNSRNSAILVGLDLSAAFDTIEHDILVDRLRTVFGVSGAALEWIRTYLSGRKQYVMAGGERSSLSECDFGVPQGSVLGPFLFSIYVSPIVDIITAHGVQFHQYADDTQLYITVQSDDDLVRLEKCTMAVRDWFTENGMLLNPDKSEVMLVASPRNAKLFAHGAAVSVAGSTIAYSVSLKSLGVTLDQSLTFDQHVQNVVKASNFHIRALQHIRPMLDREVANTIACSIVNTRLDYCNSLLYRTKVGNIKKLQRVQNSLARVVACSSQRDHITPVLKELHWLPVQQRIEYKVALVTHKVLATGQPHYLADLVSEHKPAANRGLRSASQRRLTIPTGLKSTAGQRTFTSASEAVWNRLPLELRTDKSLHSFKSKLKTYFFKDAFCM